MPLRRGHSTFSMPVSRQTASAGFSDRLLYLPDVQDIQGLTAKIREKSWHSVTIPDYVKKSVLESPC